jgi:hypothetical protein
MREGFGMSKTVNISHTDLCIATARRFMKKFALYEYKSFESSEEPDVLVFDTGTTYLFEIKVSLTDFNKDQKKDARKKVVLHWKVDYLARHIAENSANKRLARQYFRLEKEHPELFYIEPKHLGNKRYYVCPWGLIPVEKVPEGWGLYYYKHGKFFLKKESGKFRSDLRRENCLAIHALRRFASGDSTGIIINTYVLNRTQKSRNENIRITGKEDDVNYFGAESIRQDFHVAMQYAETCGETPVEAVRRTAEKYTNEQLAEAYKVLMQKIKEDKETLKTLFVLAYKCKTAGADGEVVHITPSV